jgi:hypothetical protein
MMNTFHAKKYAYHIINSLGDSLETPVYPYFRSEDGNEIMYSIGPAHGRSYLICRNSGGRYVVSKGNGLSYSQYQLLNTGEMGNDTWGLLLRQDAIRDFTVGEEISNLGIKTNQMEYVLELDKEIKIHKTNVSLKPILLQYNVECPYRICDAAFMKSTRITREVLKWEKMNDKGFDKAYLIAADVLIKNLRLMHDHGILHNAIHNQNYTWALELLDFELAHSPNYSYSKEDDARHVKDLMPREVIQTYEVINYIAWCLGENIDYKQIDSLFKEYGYDLKKFEI